jgi:hypothetical protein
MGDPKSLESRTRGCADLCNEAIRLVRLIVERRRRGRGNRRDRRRREPTAAPRLDLPDLVDDHADHHHRCAGPDRRPGSLPSSSMEHLA